MQRAVVAWLLGERAEAKPVRLVFALPALLLGDKLADKRVQPRVLPGGQRVGQLALARKAQPSLCQWYYRSCCRI